MIFKRDPAKKYYYAKRKPWKKSSIIILTVCCLLLFAVGYFSVHPIMQLLAYAGLL